MTNHHAARADKALETLRLRLLDLTARNRLINFRHKKNTSLRLISVPPDQLLETLLTETELRFAAVPEPTETELIAAGYRGINSATQQIKLLRDPPTAAEWAQYLGRETNDEMPLPTAVKSNKTPAPDHKTLHTLLFPAELETQLRKLTQLAESAIQEMGANILYLALGFLAWHEGGHEDNLRLAPLFLIPVRLHKGRLNTKTQVYEYTLSYSGEDLIPNLSLREKLRTDFAMALPDLDENTTPEAYFAAVQVLIQSQPRWQLRRQLALALLNFNKLLMYLDLDPSRWPTDANLLNHPLVAQFLSVYQPHSNTAAAPIEQCGFNEEYAIDEIGAIHTHYPLIEDADSSQHSALIDAIKGKNLVIEGPPGTGKSQTITNLIAAALAQGKKVLFVAEKLAALEVVWRRLDRAGLGEFCLELHSHKSQKHKLLTEIGERLQQHGQYRSPSELTLEISRYEAHVTALKNYALTINQSWQESGKTVHEILMAATRYRELLGMNPAAFHPAGYTPNQYTATIHRRNQEQVTAYSKVYQGIAAQLNQPGNLRTHPWYGVCNSELQLFDNEQVWAALNEWQLALRNLNHQRNELADLFGTTPNEVANTLGDAEQLKVIPALHGDELLSCLPKLRGAALMQAQAACDQLVQIAAQSAQFPTNLVSELVRNPPLVDGIARASAHLTQRVGREVRFEQLLLAGQRLAALPAHLTQFDEPRHQVAAALGEAGAHLTVSIAGLHELQTLLSVTAALPTALWKWRNPLFDNEELDELLPQLRHELAALQAIHAHVERVLAVEALPDAAAAQRLAGRLAAGGAWRWFKSDWRAARRELLSYAASPHATYPQLLDSLAQLTAFNRKLRQLDQHPQYRAALGEQVRGLATDLTALETLRAWYRRVRQEYGIGFGGRVALGEAVLQLPAQVAAALRSLDERGLAQQVSTILAELRILQTIFAPAPELRDHHAPLIGDAGVIALLLRTLKAALNGCAALLPNGLKTALTIGELAAQVEQLVALREALAQWQQADVERQLFDGQVNLVNGDAPDFVAALSQVTHTCALAEWLAGLPQPALREYLYRDAAAAFAYLSAKTTSWQQTLAERVRTHAAFAALVTLDDEAWLAPPADCQFDLLLARNEHALAQREWLQNWIYYLRQQVQLNALGFGQLTAAVANGDLPSNQIENAYYAGVFDYLARAIFREMPQLEQFSGLAQTALQDEFRRCDQQLKSLQCAQIAWRIDQTPVPAGVTSTYVNERTERALLDHELSKKQRHIPVRALLQRAGRALVALKPCFMMGPMSVAHYLAPGNFQFDLIIMDEASQIKPEDALGAIARGRQLVVVGDPKQLPPTSFFDRAIEEQSDEPLTAIEESESILDATLPVFPARRLRWHYRSQHESLIAFSNEAFYDGDLMLFPSPHHQSDEYGIQYVRVAAGCFVHQCNIEEARCIAEAVQAHFQSNPNETLGLVAMNAKQQAQLETAIEALAKTDPVLRLQLEEDANRAEPLFIKNLENVQGDERDVIFISMTYGPQTPGGKVPQRFGPINQDVGWRRLNVLFTRSRKRMHIFSSMDASDIVIGESSKDGVKALKDFLSYCETGVIHQTEHDTGRAPDSDFEIAVMTALRSEGFECRPQVGVAGFFIDLAVLDPNNPGRYLMGIECDGVSYHSAKSVRDRDRLRQMILERLGWRIRRIWSTDWFKNPRGELAPIIRELHALKSSPTDAANDSDNDLSQPPALTEYDANEEPALCAVVASSFQWSINRISD
ncbi:DUF4011 domain-containing protein [Rhodoferax sp. 4810]|uniref:DUF4011 domain-containing protein n=1 Tax=Thiospirillum jenense TaxID=1653858 RepID=A0A839HCD5_9GAMM|nr:DUF4011 domain-containing anti-phage protein Hhe [Thiospirillum jenense]MBB1076274.1 DUF4011 domain-containing protein [Rhodoferax jenense]MBB1124867.1 DUF4011 domain-containing protein [Thiospirillum jenense]